MFTTILLFVGLTATTVFARTGFQNQVPNGNNVKIDGETWLQLGHLSRVASGANLGPFGDDVHDNEDLFPNFWAAVCDLDSDGDGFTNGEELLDPNCVWRSSDDDALLEDGIPTHPGFGPDAVIPGVSTKIKVHAAFMTLAWLFFAPVGVITAVVLKVKTKSVTKVNWFKIHKVCVGTAVYLTMIAYVCMVYETEDFLLNSKHTKFGHAVVILAIIQPLSGVYRVHINKDGSKSNLRLGWEYFHQIVGRLLLILAVVAVYLGYDIALFFDDGVRSTMKVISLILLVVGAIFCIAYVFLRKDERKEPELPTQQEKKEEPKPEVKEVKEVKKKVDDVAKEVKKEEGKIVEATTAKSSEVDKKVTTS